MSEYGRLDPPPTPEQVARATRGMPPMTRDEVYIHTRILASYNPEHYKDRPGCDDWRDRAFRNERRAFVATILDLYRQLDAMTCRLPADKIAPYPEPMYPGDITLGC